MNIASINALQGDVPKRDAVVAPGQASVASDAPEQLRETPRAVERARGADTDAGSTMDREEVESLAEEVRVQLQSKGTELKFRVLEDHTGIQVEMRDPESDKVIKKIPSDELLRLSESLKDQSAHLLNKTF